MFHQDSSAQWSKSWIWKICYAKYIKSTRQKSSQFRLYITCVWQKRERMGVCEMTVKRTGLVLLDCTPGFAGRAIQWHSLVRFTAISHTPMRSRYMIWRLSTCFPCAIPNYLWKNTFSTNAWSYHRWRELIAAKQPHDLSIKTRTYFARRKKTQI